MPTPNEFPVVCFGHIEETIKDVKQEDCEPDFIIFHSGDDLSVLSLDPIFVYTCGCEEAVDVALANAMVDTGKIDENYVFKDHFYEYFSAASLEKYMHWKLGSIKRNVELLSEYTKKAPEDLSSGA